MAARRITVAGAVAGVLALAAPLIGCGGGGGDNKAQAPPPVAKPQDFPKANGKTLAQLLKGVDTNGPVLSATGATFKPGRNRYGFGLFDRARAQIADAPVALYVSSIRGGPARGPFPAHYESLQVPPQFQSRTVASDPNAARSLYVANVDFPKQGDYVVIGIVRLDDRLVAATPANAPLRVSKRSPIPDVGERPPLIHTPTRASVGGNVSAIDTRQPPDDMHEVDFASVVGKKPVVIVFATPALCQSRVCGPVVDIAEQVKAKLGDKAAFIHMEIYRENTVSKGYRPQFLAWHLPTEPWVFTLDRKGRIAARIEGAYSERELEAAVQAALRR